MSRAYWLCQRAAAAGQSKVPGVLAVSQKKREKEKRREKAHLRSK